jgi:hypothetical protein
MTEFVCYKKSNLLKKYKVTIFTCDLSSNMIDNIGAEKNSSKKVEIHLTMEY